jgi:hypothetical protein
VLHHQRGLISSALHAFKAPPVAATGLLPRLFVPDLCVRRSPRCAEELRFRVFSLQLKSCIFTPLHSPPGLELRHRSPRCAEELRFRVFSLQLKSCIFTPLHSPPGLELRRLAPLTSLVKLESCVVAMLQNPPGLEFRAFALFQHPLGLELRNLVLLLRPLGLESCVFTPLQNSPGLECLVFSLFQWPASCVVDCLVKRKLLAALLATLARPAGRDELDRDLVGRSVRRVAAARVCFRAAPPPGWAELGAVQGNVPVKLRAGRGGSFWLPPVVAKAESHRPQLVREVLLRGGRWSGSCPKMVPGEAGALAVSGRSGASKCAVDARKSSSSRWLFLSVKLRFLIIRRPHTVPCIQDHRHCVGIL